MDLDLSTSRRGDRVVVTVGGEVDLDTAPQLREHASQALHEASPHVVIDLSDVSFLDSTGLKTLLDVQRQADAAGGSFAVAGASRTVLRLLSLTGLDQAIPLYDTVADALQTPPGSAASP